MGIYKEEVLKCDLCGHKLYKRDVMINNGSYQKDYINYKFEDKEYDICFNCSGKILDIFILPNIQNEFINYINDFHKKINPLSFRNIKIDFDNISFKVKE